MDDGRGKRRGNAFLLKSGLDYLDQGMSVFDSDLRLVACNRRAAELLAIPAKLSKPGTCFGDVIRHFAERGDYGPGDIEEMVDQRVAAARRCLRHYSERRGYDHRVLAAQTYPLPGGGFVVVLIDISDRSKAEAMTPERNEELEARVNRRTQELRALNEELRHSIREVQESSAAQRRSEEALRDAQKMSAIGQLAGGLAHDFNNFLTIIAGNLSLLRERTDDQAFTEYIDPALRASRRGIDITKRLLAFARRQSLEPASVELRQLFPGVIQLLSHSLPANIIVDYQEDEAAWHVRADPHQLENALVNMALNARDAMPDGGVLRFRSENVSVSDPSDLNKELAPGVYVRIEVGDTGIGMNQETLDRVFEPFFTTKPFGAGSGLGLSMVYGFVRQSGGHITVRSVQGHGTTVSMLLPRVPAAVAMEIDPQPPLPEPGDGQLVLLVEDDDDVRVLVRRHLLDLGYNVLEARNAEEAQELFDSVSDIGIVLSDVVMPGPSDGYALARHARRRKPGVRVVLMSGFVDPAQRRYPDEQEWLLLRKPFSRDELGRMIREGCLER